MLKIKKISESVGKKVYTDDGEFFGEIEEANLLNNKVESWRIRIGGVLANMFNGARGVIIPHNYVKSVGNIFIINQLAMPSQQEEVSELPSDVDLAI